MGLFRRVARARLAGRVVRQLRRAGCIEVRYDPHGHQIRFRHESRRPEGRESEGQNARAGSEGPLSVLELAPLPAGFGRRRRREVDRFVAGLLAGRPSGDGVPRAWHDIRPMLRPVLRGGTPGAPLHRPVLPFLSEFVVIDLPDTMTYVGVDQPATWGVDAAAVFAAARANLSGASLQGVATEPMVVRFVDDGDAYWTSHLLLQHWLERLAGQVGGRAVAFAPERGTLLVTADGSDHLRGLFVQAEEIYAKTSRPISPMAYTSDDAGCPIPYAVSPSHPLFRSVERAERVLAVEEYARQAAREAEESDLGPGARPADVELVGSDTTGWRTRAIWPHDAPALLPEADEIQLGDDVIPWSAVAAGLTPAPGWEPRRWSASGWPSRKENDANPNLDQRR